MAVNLAPIGNDAPYVDDDGNPFVGANLFTYVAGSSTPATTYTTSAGSVQNSNPMPLNSGGYPTTSGNQTQIWLTAGVAYKFALETSGGTPIWTRDNISGVNDTSITIDQWVAGPAPTFISTTSFSLVGDQTTTFHIGRRVKTTNSGGTIYSTITNSVFAAVTTVTVANDSGVLDSGLSAVSYGLLSATNPSTPLLNDSYPIVSGSSDKTKKLRLEVDALTASTTRVLTIQDQDMTVGAVIDAPQATTSGTSKDFSIPSWVKQISITLVGFSTNGTSLPQIQLGDSGGIETSGYLGASGVMGDSTPTSVGNATTGFAIQTASAANVTHGTITLTLHNAATFTWAAAGVFGHSNTAGVLITVGSKSLSAALTTVRLTTVNGTDVFDAGSVNVVYH